MMRIYDGRPAFYQWDINQKITSRDLRVGDEIHFFNIKQQNAMVLVAYEFEGNVVVDVPNILLQNALTIMVYRWIEDGDSAYTLKDYAFEVKQRAKPSDYTYTETAYKSWEAIVSAVANAEAAQAIAEKCARDADESASKANEHEVNARNAEELANKHADAARIHEINTSSSREVVEKAEASALESRTYAENAAKAAATSEANAKTSEQNVEQYEKNAKTSEENAAKSAEEAKNSALSAKGVADWNAVEGESGHILNRTHWVDPIVQILPETIFTFNESGYMTNGSHSITPLKYLVHGETYTVNWNGVTYECVANTLRKANNPEIIIGFSLSKKDIFAIHIADPSMVEEATFTVNASAYDGSTEAAVSITHGSETIHKLPVKFLPESVPYAEPTLVEILPETDLGTLPTPQKNHYCIDHPIGLEVGQTYKVRYLGIVSELVAQDASRGDIVAYKLIDENNAIFAIYEYPNGNSDGYYVDINYPTTTLDYIVSIYHKTEIVHKLDNKYLDMDAIREEVTIPGSGGNVDLTGVVKSVNGVTPDTNGNVEITIPDSGGNVDLGVTGATVGQMVKISAVDEEGKPTAWEAVSTLNTELFPVSHQFGDVEVFILPETELTFVTNPDVGLVMAMFTPSTMLIEDGVYFVTFAGVEYECTPFRIDEGAYYLGNTVINDGVDNGMPFGVLVSEYMNAVISYVGETTANVSIKGIHPIPIAPEYAPEPVCIDLKALGLGTVHNADKVEVALSEDVRPVIEKQFRIAAKQGIIRLKFDYDLRIMTMLYPAGTSTGGIGGYVTLPMLIHDDTSGGGNYMMRTLYHDNIIHMQYTDGTLSAVARRVTLATEV